MNKYILETNELTKVFGKQKAVKFSIWITRT